MSLGVKVAQAVRRGKKSRKSGHCLQRCGDNGHKQVQGYDAVDRAELEELIHLSLGLTRSDGAWVRSQLPLKSERPGNFKKRSLKTVAHLWVDESGMSEGDYPVSVDHIRR